MSTSLFVVQVFNGLQLGILLFLVAAGLTLVFGVMDFINLAHGVQYMLGAYLAVTFYRLTGSVFAGLLLALPASMAFGLLLEVLVFRHLYERDHLEQVLATFGVILFLNQGVKIVWGAAPLNMGVPDLLSGSVPLMEGLRYPVYRFAIIAAGLAVAGALYLFVTKTRVGMLVRAGPPMRHGLGAGGRHQAAVHDRVRLRRHAGGLCRRDGGADPVGGARHGRPDPDPRLRRHRHRRHRLDPRRVRGRVAGRRIDTLGRSFMTDGLRLFLSPSTARIIGPALASMAIYLLMAVVLAVRPAGLFPAKGRA